MEWLRVERGSLIVDGTLGMGGHTEAFLKRGAKVYAFEWNEDSLEVVSERLKEYGDNLQVFPISFVYIKEVLQRERLLADGVLLDLGLSSFLIERSGRGFSFQKDEPLDMRMSLELKLTAEDLLNRSSEKELGEILKRGEVPRASSFAKYICSVRKKKPLAKTFDLVSVVRDFYHPSKKKEKDLLALVFQAIRIEVNHELENLERALREIPEVLRSGGRLAVISFHSLEDRMVKRTFKEDERLLVLTKKPVRPSLEEIRENPRARSAKLRVAERRS
ncbi:MAG: 16S rRNA (cytosine(1402)-N(4))-methyltransferase RsmH [Caldimicrobium sp.]|nr:16S rRNA (cytosine(1402)-N(4))-methyltransferase RsmH [Caldimicrobium sp.]MCX7612967.1 16S rRNA (cytosine(1402)-N(4))-methyltransferase RsmH [Caldimicrobium sp.]MDW8183205.1 16S rRNA (cytosine(1402)-N(4))-methyltransferase RsmH [Caldimicrobium sp.]